MFRRISKGAELYDPRVVMTMRSAALKPFLPKSRTMLLRTISTACACLRQAPYEAAADGFCAGDRAQ